MIRKKTGFKELTILVLASAALVSVACGDDDGTGDPGETAGSSGTGTAGSSSTAGKNNGGSAGKNNGGSAGNGGANTAGSGNGGVNNGGTAGGGTAGGGGDAGSDTIGGEAGMGGVPTDGGMGGEGGEPVGGMGGDGGMGGEGGMAGPDMDVLMNPGFEQPIGTGSQPPDSGTAVFPDWSNVTTPPGASYIQWGQLANNEQHGGSVRLAQYSASAFVATVEQQVSPIADGKYAFSVWITRAGADKLNESYLYAVGHDLDTPNEKQTISTDTAIGSTWMKVTLSPIVVESGSLTIGMKTDAKAGGWINFDDATLERLPD